MSFKMLIVDDEPIICRGLRYTIPWEKYNIEVVDTAYDGEDAIRKISQCGKIDLVITDVRMPNMDGLQLVSYLKKHFPKINTIMISGYDEFSYAQKAIQSGVKDYLLKPVNIDDLVRKVKNIISEIENERKSMNEMLRTGLKNAIFQSISEFSAQNNSYLEEYKNVFIYPFFSNVDEYMKRTKNLSNHELEHFKMSWKNFVENKATQLGYDAISIFTEKNTLLTCLLIENKELKPKSIAEKLLDNALTEIPLSFIYSEKVVTVTQLSEKYKQLIDKRIYLPLRKKQKIVFINEVKERQNQPKYPHNIEKKLLDAIFKFNTTNKEVKKVINDLFNYFQSSGYFLREVRQVCSDMIRKIVNQYEVLRAGKYLQTDLHFQQSIDVSLFNSFQLLQEVFEEDINAIISKLDLKKTRKQDWLMKLAEDYIKEYYKSNIKVHEVADVINISPNYFSTLFKQKTGENYNEYVNKLRVEEAKQLLTNTPFKVSEVSEQVGFHEYKYFVEVFKKFTGMTPTNYRKLMALD